MNEQTTLCHPLQPVTESEESLRHALDVSPAALLIVDLDGRIALANRTTRDILGRSPEELVGRRIDSMSVAVRDSDGNVIPTSELPLVVALREGREVLGRELSVTTSSGDTRYLLASAAPLTDENGCRSGAVVSIMDVSQMKRSEQDLAESERKQRQASLNRLKRLKYPRFFS
jgi:PAS domain S-box-containing protein